MTGKRKMNAPMWFVRLFWSIVDVRSVALPWPEIKDLLSFINYRYNLYYIDNKRINFFEKLTVLNNICPTCLRWKEFATIWVGSYNILAGRRSLNVTRVLKSKSFVDFLAVSIAELVYKVRTRAEYWRKYWNNLIILH